MLKRPEKLDLQRGKRDEVDASENSLVKEDSDPRGLMAKLTSEMGRKIEKKLATKR